MTDFVDVLYEKRGGVAWVTINRPERLNAFRHRTVEELIEAFEDAWADGAVGVIVLTGAGDRAFCVGGDFKEKTEAGYGPPRPLEPGIRITHLQSLIRGCPKPVIAMVNGYAIGGGHVLAALCDLSIAAEHATFGQVGPKVGSVDPGFGTAYLAQVIGEKRAREMWYLCRQYTAQQALQWGLVNAVVPAERLRAETEAWCKELLERSPTALALAKQSFAAATDALIGVTRLGMAGLTLYLGSEEGREFAQAFKERRPPDVERFRRGPDDDPTRR